MFGHLLITAQTYLYRLVIMLLITINDVLLALTEGNYSR